MTEIHWFWIHLGVGFIYSIYVIFRHRPPVVTFAWILAFFLFPYLGPIFYSFFGYRRLSLKKRLEKSLYDLKTKENVLPALTRPLPPDLWRLARLGATLTEFGVSEGNRIRVFEEPYSTYGAIAQAIRGAQHHVHLEYYKFQSDETGRYFRDLLCEMAAKGVQCRLLLDALGCIRMPRSFIAPLKKAGVHVEFFWPLVLWRPWSWHLRNHRKLVVVDGQTAFIGSQNIGNEYLQWRNRKLSWRDTAIRVQGPVVHQIQTLFLEDWAATTRKELMEPQFFPPQKTEGGGLVQTLPTGPDENEHALMMVLVEMLSLAQQRVTITTPYLIASESLMLALAAAVRRGISVEVLVPQKSDLAWVDWAGRSWQRDLVAVGVRVFRYSKTFVHAKVVTVDGRVALVGSANMDTRSFLLNFEASLLLYDESSVIQLEETFNRTVQSAQEVDAAMIKSQGVISTWVEGLFRVFSPLL